MSARDALLEVGRGFGLADDVSLSELRSSAWLERLRKVHKMRLMSRSQTVGVVVDPAVWQALEAAVQDVLEDMLIEEQWGDRVDHERRPASVAGPALMKALETDGTPKRNA